MKTLWNLLIDYCSTVPYIGYIYLTKINFIWSSNKIQSWSLFICFYMGYHQEIFIPFKSNIRLLSDQRSLRNINSKVSTRTCLTISWRSSFTTNPNFVHSTTAIVAVHFIISEEKLLLRSNINISINNYITHIASRWVTSLW